MKYNKNYDNYSDILISMPQFEKAETIRFSDVRNNTLNETVGVEKINLPVEQPVEPVDENHEQPVQRPIERVKQMDKLDLERENIMNMINKNKVKEVDIDSLIDNSNNTEPSNKTEKRVTRRRFRLFKNVS